MDYITKLVGHGPQWWMDGLQECILSEWRRVRTRCPRDFICSLHAVLLESRPTCIKHDGILLFIRLSTIDQECN
jgi:hypothetical protein